MRPANRVVLAVVFVVFAGGARIAARTLRVSHRLEATTPGRQAQSPNGPVLHVPRLAGTVILDGDTDDPCWVAPPGPARTGPFVRENGAPARPYSDARLVWGDGHLYAALYAADEDIRAPVDQQDGPLWMGDSFRLIFTRDDAEYSIEVSPNGVVTDAFRRQGGVLDYTWSSGAHVAHDRDGTVNDPTDADEEWGIEMAVPLESLGMRGQPGERIGFAARRCDTPKSAPRACANWNGELIID